MNAVKEIKKISGKEPEILTDEWRNPYRILTCENGTKTAYIFSVPVFAYDTYSLISEEWEKIDGFRYSRGINSKNVYKGRKITLENFIDFAEIRTGKGQDCVVKPGMNGINIFSDSSELCFELKTGYPYPVKENGLSFALMEAKHLPFLTVTPFLSETRDGRFVPAFIDTREWGERGYSFRIYSGEKQVRLSAEINLYLPKTVFDTTVEAENPDRNNVYGSYALIGKTDRFGEQRLLLRLNNTEVMLNGLGNVLKAELYIPKFGIYKGELGAYKISEPWCTFNTCWSDMPALGREATALTEVNGYLKADITGMLCFHPNYGIILKSIEKNSLCAVSTADSCDHPLIIKIQYE